METENVFMDQNTFLYIMDPNDHKKHVTFGKKYVYLLLPLGGKYLFIYIPIFNFRMRALRAAFYFHKLDLRN